MVRRAFILTQFDIAFKALVVFNYLTGLRRIIVSPLYKFLLKRQIVVEPAVVYSSGAETVLGLVEILLINVDFRYFEERDDCDITQVVHLDKSRK